MRCRQLLVGAAAARQGCLLLVGAAASGSICCSVCACQSAYCSLPVVFSVLAQSASASFVRWLPRYKCYCCCRCCCCCCRCRRCVAWPVRARWLVGADCSYLLVVAAAAAPPSVCGRQSVCVGGSLFSLCTRRECCCCCCCCPCYVPLLCWLSNETERATAGSIDPTAPRQPLFWRRCGSAGSGSPLVVIASLDSHCPANTGPFTSFCPLLPSDSRLSRPSVRVRSAVQQFCAFAIHPLSSSTAP